jgi:hypothetical protein
MHQLVQNSSAWDANNFGCVASIAANSTLFKFHPSMLKGGGDN